MTLRHCAPLPRGTQRTGCFLRKPVVKGSLTPSAEKSPPSRIATAASAIARTATQVKLRDTDTARAGGNEVSE